ncbi:MAG: bifunctional 3,4-dihydroxy-2-butanone-4-phosphate synthase/GTP cyclohydrolase II [Candidatus Neomarinimicrobiota bacterium]|jgi:3,4-dihydroxy 2-butanone 4-phosphate synthase/GTP cyclohydrolase II|nr:bifunctional 3,4-dihydroxy-2-butanone-4-phosphate synthase/GTP cyclohydrolase II [Candidatus Neomarinimicrobiota bacterium]MDX9780172.1 bifunctional 3,4-dihydroxy-2-butanone-4-phosphate synthase/GTP cyclohydrolase II [bacterium]
MEATLKLSTVEEAVEEIQKGKMIIVVDDPRRENEGDLVQAGEFVTPASVNFAAKEGRGLICAAVEQEIAERLELHEMAGENSSLHCTRFTVSVDALEGTSTGISAADRAKTFAVLTAPDSTPKELGRPGHIFPIVAKKGGVLRRTGHTEASVDLCRLAGLRPVGMMCEIMAEDGTMMRLPQLGTFAEKHGLKILAIEDLIRYRRKKERLIEKVTTVNFPNAYGDFKLTLYRDLTDNKEHMAITMGNFESDTPVLVRMHSECITGDVFHSARCDCGEQKDAALKKIAEEGCGALIYLRQEGRGIGLKHKIMAYELQDQGLDTVEANIRLGFQPDLRDYGAGAQIIKDLGIRRIKLMTNNPKKIIGLSGYDLEIVERVPLEIAATVNNKSYLETKRDKMGHFILNGNKERKE